MYEEREGLLIIYIANGLVRPHGIGTVSLDCPQSNGRNTTLTLFDVIYIPEFPINLLSRMKLMAVSGYARDSKLLLKGDQELCQFDSGLLLIENPRYLAFVLLAVIEKAPVDIELWHRRLGYLNLDAVKVTQGIVKGLIY
jgi:hypothetical protein